MSDEYIQLNPDVKEWSRRTAADGVWLNTNTIQPIKTHIDRLNSAVNNLDIAIDNEMSARSVADNTMSENISAISGNVSSISSKLIDKIDVSSKGIANGVATLDSAGKIPASQIPPAGDLEVGTDLAVDNSAIKVNTDGTVANSAEMSFVAGSATYASGTGAAAYGIGTSAKHDGSFVAGIGNYSNNSAQFVVGQWCESASSGVKFSVGVGSGDNDRKNEFTVSDDGVCVTDCLSSKEVGCSFGLSAHPYNIVFPYISESANSIITAGTSAEVDALKVARINFRALPNDDGDIQNGYIEYTHFDNTNVWVSTGTVPDSDFFGNTRISDGFTVTSNQPNTMFIAKNASGQYLKYNNISAENIYVSADCGFSCLTGSNAWSYGDNLSGAQFYLNMGVGTASNNQWTITIPSKKKAMITPCFTVYKPASTNGNECIFYVGLTTDNKAPQTGTNFTTASCNFLNNIWHRIEARPNGEDVGLLAKDTYMPALYYWNGSNNDITARVRIFKYSTYNNWSVACQDVNWMIL